MKKRGFYSSASLAFCIPFIVSVTINAVEEFVELAALCGLIRRFCWKEDLVYRYIKKSYKLIKNL